ncbi:MAG: ATP-binding protein [Deltaproteobacteria bacterium]|nr:ATP-binding protein [Deltaproteobacteria bacterium]
MTPIEIDYQEGQKRQVAEIKFLIHDLRVERFINNIIHFHVTLNTDLEIYGVEQAHAFHTDDLDNLKQYAAAIRRAFRDYSNAVTNFSPDKTIIVTGRRYIETVRKICDLILNPLWGRFDRTLTFLPDDSRSVLARHHYRNNIRWMCGVYYRIDYFLQELDDHDIVEVFDIGSDIIHYTNNIIYGYIVEKGHSRVEIQIEKEGPAVVRGNRNRFRRMYFNLIMNAVDALEGLPVGMIRVKVSADGERATLAVSDNGSGMYPEKIKNLLRERETLDGELRSLGFVFVRQTVTDFGGELKVDSEIDKGTTISVIVPYLPDHEPPPQKQSKCQQYAVMPFQDLVDGRPGVAIIDREQRAEAREATTYPAAGEPAPTLQTPAPPAASEAPPEAAPEAPTRRAQIEDAPLDWNPKDHQENCGRILWNDYERSLAPYPGCVFAIGVTYEQRIDCFAHRPYEQHWNISHEDLSPMLYDATIRGRLEENEEKRVELILKEPHSVASYFDLKEIEEGRSALRFVEMIHDEYILIARKLIATGLPGDLVTHLTGVSKFLPEAEIALGPAPFLLRAIAAMPLSTELPDASS